MEYNAKEYINIALPKGRIGKLTIDLFEHAGMKFDRELLSSRKLVIEDENNGMRFFMVKPSDVPTYVEYGAADMGISGRDTLMEEKRNLFEVLDLGFGACRMVVAGPASLKGNGESYQRVATKYPEIARHYFEKRKSKSIEVIKLNGSVELAPLVGLSDVIVDIVESGKTLEENGLVVLETISDISAMLVVNRASFKMKNERITGLMERLKASVEEGKA